MGNLGRHNKMPLPVGRDLFRKLVGDVFACPVELVLYLNPSESYSQSCISVENFYKVTEVLTVFKGAKAAIRITCLSLLCLQEARPQRITRDN